MMSISFIKQLRNQTNRYFLKLFVVLFCRTFDMRLSLKLLQVYINTYSTYSTFNLFFPIEIYDGFLTPTRHREHTIHLC